MILKVWNFGVLEIVEVSNVVKILKILNFSGVVLGICSLD